MIRPGHLTQRVASLHIVLIKNLFFLPFGSCCGHQELQVCVGTSRMCSLCSGPSPSLITLRDQDAACPGQVSDPQLCTTI